MYTSSVAETTKSAYIDACKGGYYWPSMKQDAADLQGKCTKCQECLDVQEALFLEEAGDWRQPYLDFLEHKLLPSNRNDALKVQKKSTRFFVEDGLLFRRGLNQAPLRCSDGDEVTTVLKEVHSGDCGEHQRGSRLFKKSCSWDTTGQPWKLIPYPSQGSVKHVNSSETRSTLQQLSYIVCPLFDLFIHEPLTWLDPLNHLHEDSVGSSLPRNVTLSGSK